MWQWMEREAKGKEKKEEKKKKGGGVILGRLRLLNTHVAYLSDRDELCQSLIHC
jgi:hypothetical protein